MVGRHLAISDATFRRAPPSSPHAKPRREHRTPAKPSELGPTRSCRLGRQEGGSLPRLHVNPPTH
ncbi:hypothetical protein GW17_00056677, partial [Ensete ventricosum]